AEKIAYTNAKTTPARMRRKEVPIPSSKAKPLLLMLIYNHLPPYHTPSLPHLLPLQQCIKFLYLSVQPDANIHCRDSIRWNWLGQIVVSTGNGNCVCQFVRDSNPVPASHQFVRDSNPVPASH